MRIKKREPFYWERVTDGAGAWINRAKPHGPPGEELAALRSGIGRAPGTVPQMWPYYAVEIPDVHLTARADQWRPPSILEAEHHALTLYAVHQQSESVPVHRTDPHSELGAALRVLRQANGDESRVAAIDRRVAAAMTANSMAALAVHLRGLINLLKGLDRPRALDYSRLVDDLAVWSLPARRPAVRRRWGGQYFAWSKPSPEDGEGAESRASA